MPYRSPSKQRLEELIALARTYRGWSSKDLARELGRDVHHLVPNSGVPKLDIVVALAEALDWTVQDVVDDLYGNVPSGVGEKPAETWAELDRGAWEALQKGDYSRAASIARREFFAATNGHERAMACIRECGAWDGVGRYLVAMECCQRGLRERERSSEASLALRNNLSHLHYLLGNYEEAVGVASRTIDDVRAGDYESRALDASLGFALYVRGVSTRAVLAAAGECSERDVDRALADLEEAITRLRPAEATAIPPMHEAIARIAEGSSLAIKALTDREPSDAALDRFVRALEAASTLDFASNKLAAEALGWWCIFGCELVARTIPRGDDQAARLLAIFTNRASDAAAALGNWALRERVWYFELLRHDHSGSTGEELDPWTLDDEDARELSGAMARFPKFRAIGWQVLRAAKVGGQ